MKGSNESPQERLETDGSYSDDVDELGVACPPHTTEKKLMARIDAHLLPFISILYLLAFLDRVNIANAKSFGLVADLGLDAGGVQYNTILTIFFVPCKFAHLCPHHFCCFFFFFFFGTYPATHAIFMQTYFSRYLPIFCSKSSHRGYGSPSAASALVLSWYSRVSRKTSRAFWPHAFS